MNWIFPYGCYLRRSSIFNHVGLSEHFNQSAIATLSCISFTVCIPDFFTVPKFGLTAFGRWKGTSFSLLSCIFPLCLLSYLSLFFSFSPSIFSGGGNKYFCWKHMIFSIPWLSNYGLFSMGIFIRLIAPLLGKSFMGCVLFHSPDCSKPHTCFS